MAKMQSLEEEVLMKEGTLAAEQAVKSRSAQERSAMAVVEPGAFDVNRMQEDASCFDGEENEPQTDGDEMESYDNQACLPRG